MALQYDTPVTSADLNASLAANPAISTSTAAAISALLDLGNVDTVVAGSFNAETGAVTAPEGETPAFVSVTSTAVAGDNVNVDLTAVADASVIVFETDANVTATLDTSAPVATFARAAIAEAAVVEATASTPEKIIIGGNGNDVLTVTGDTNVRLEGGDGNDVLTTDAGDDVVVGGKGTNVISTGAGNDLIITGQGNDVIDAGEGRDTVQFTGLRGDFGVTQTGETLVLNDGTFTTTVKNAEFFSFDNGGSIAVVDSEDEATALGLYQGLLARDADNSGAESFTAAVEGGTSLTSIASSFLSSSEYLNSVNDDYVEGLFQGLLGREADAGGETAYLDALANGLSRVDAALSIAASEEASTLTNTQFVEGLYQGALGRDSDPEGLDAYVTLLSYGGSRADVANMIINSAEATDNANEAFVDSLYVNALGRTAEAEGKAVWVDALANGVSQADVAIGIVGSTEAHDHATNVIVINGQV